MTAKLQVNVHNEWDRLNAVVVGIPDYNCIPGPEPSFQALMKFSHGKQIAAEEFTPGLRPTESYVKAQRELDNFIRILKDYNVAVLRPDAIDWSSPVSTPWWSVPVMCGASCPRDLLTVIGDEIIEAGMSWRCRFFEYSAYRSLIKRCLEDDPDCKWTAAPKPVLADLAYEMDYPCWDEFNIEERKRMIEEKHYITNEHDIIFEAADISKFGKDVFVKNGFTTNQRGVDWLRRNLKSSSYRVHSVTFPSDLFPMHIDSCFVPILAPTKERRGIIWNNPDRLLHPEKWSMFQPSFEILHAPQPAHDRGTPRSICSKWLSMNMLHLDPSTVVVEETEKETIRALESLGIKAVPCAFRACYEFGGSFNCQTTCINREGRRENYFPHLD